MASENSAAKKVQHLIDELNSNQNPEFENHKIILLTSIWSSGLDYKKYVAELVQLAIEGDVQEIFEIETILDNFEFIPADDVLNEALLILGNYLNEHKENSTKNDMLIQLGVILKRMNDD